MKEAPFGVLFFSPAFHAPPPQVPCGSGLARESSGSDCINVECAAVVASRLCSRRLLQIIGGMSKFGHKKSTPKGAFSLAGCLALQRSRQVGLDGGEHSLEAFGVAGNDVAFFKEIVAAGEVAHQAAGFLDQ